MTIRITKEFLLYSTLFLMITTFGTLYMAQSKAIYEDGQALTADKQSSQDNNKTNKRSENVPNHQSTQNGEVLGIVQ
ncbi:hypothetical protein [Macrococcus lamae]|uniref:Uncharacterized protein n=1 Tax=Macrococcus lamae TaxID=198484 RepID=A0A4R6BSR8_9STAP|nr:hypothetical protein [Macrococcus lamae]TDM05256.1 hypothetical protein ERX29_10120 [Macrococcus lamae]